MSNKKKPEFKEVCEYAKKSIDFIVGKKASHLPFEFKEEIKQDALMRAWTSYESLDPDKGWRSFIQLHCRGALKDYLKYGHGDIESELTANESRKKPEFIDVVHIYTSIRNGERIRDVMIRQEKKRHSEIIQAKRLEIQDDDGTDLSVENVLGIVGHFDIQNMKVEHFKPNWDLLGRLIVKDEDLHIVCKVLIGVSQEEIAEQLITDKRKTASRERVSQRFHEFFERLDSVANLTDQWTDQMIFALGLSKNYFMDEEDNGLGWDLEEFNIYDPDSFRLVEAHLRLQEKLDDKQLSFNFDS